MSITASCLTMAVVSVVHNCRHIIADSMYVRPFVLMETLNDGGISICTRRTSLHYPSPAKFWTSSLTAVRKQPVLYPTSAQLQHHICMSCQQAPVPNTPSFMDGIIVTLRFIAAAPTLQLLRQIAESPASRKAAKPSIFSQVASSAVRKKTCKLEERQQGRQKRSERNTKALNTGTEKATCTSTSTGKGVKTAKAMPMRMAAPANAGSDQDVFASPAVRRKRPRSSPGSADAATGSGNPFSTYGHYSRPPPPSPSSRLGVGVGSPAPASGVDLSQEEEEEGEGVTSMNALTPAASRNARGTPETPLQGGYGSVSSPVLLVDLSQEDEGGGEGAAKSDNVTGLTQELHGSQSRPEALAGTATKEDGDAPSLTLSADCRSSGGDVFDSERGKSLAEGGQQDREAEEQSLASKLFFLVSGNTGRVHVYKKEEREEGGGSGLFDCGFDEEEEDTKPLHCRSVC